ncbi:MAG: PDZ domain-containing protein, partial [Bryobacterales bacterium]|nr:PDZ domain-containing protein [Bryobacterales bacterium]
MTQPPRHGQSRQRQPDPQHEEKNQDLIFPHYRTSAPFRKHLRQKGYTETSPGGRRLKANWRSYLFVPVVIAFGAVVGSFFGPGLTGVSAATGDGNDVEAALKTFSRVYNLVEENFADKVTADKAIYKGAVPGMLRTLDPHSSFFDPRDFQLLREEQKGHYYGVGMTVAPKNNRTMVIAPFPGSPAYKAGIRPGDVIMTVNDKSTENLRTDEVADLLKGPKGTPVQVVVAREGAPSNLTFNIVRGEIARPSVPQAFFVKPGIAYAAIEQFNENTSTELEETLKKLPESQVKGLILDLRNNPGGLPEQAIDMSDLFLTSGTIVSPR